MLAEHFCCCQALLAEFFQVVVPFPVYGLSALIAQVGIWQVFVFGAMVRRGQLSIGPLRRLKTHRGSFVWDGDEDDV